MRFEEDLALIDTFTCLYDQKPVWLLPIVFPSTDRAPPIVAPSSPETYKMFVFQVETVAIRTQVRHRDSSWRDDAPHVVRASDHDEFLHNAQLSCLILCYLLKGFFYSVRGPFRGLYFNPENAFVFFPVSTFQGCNKCHHGILLAPSILWLVIQLPLALYSCLLFFFSLFSKLLYSFSFSEKVFPHSSYVLFFSCHFPKHSTMRLLPHELSPLPICQWFFSFCLQRESLKHFWHMLVVYDSSPSRITTDADCQKLRFFSMH